MQIFARGPPDTIIENIAIHNMVIYAKNITRHYHRWGAPLHSKLTLLFSPNDTCANTFPSIGVRLDNLFKFINYLGYQETKVLTYIDFFTQY